MRDFRGKTAVVTGAASGIGLALARRFAAEGMNVVLADIEEPALSEAASSIKSDMGVVAVRTDVSKWKSVVALAERTFAEFGTAHIVCNNAGVGTGGRIESTSVDDWRWVVGVNLFGVIHGVNAFLPRLVQQNEGHIVNTASMAGLFVPPYCATYAVTKHAIVTFTRALHAELALTKSAVGASVLCPGIVKTRFLECARNRPGRKVPVRLTPEAIAWNEAGISPESVADVTLQAIRERRLIVMTHPDLLSLVRADFDAMLFSIQYAEQQ